VSASTLQLTLRSRAAKYGLMFLGLAAIFLFFAFEDYQAHRSNETTISIAVLFLCTGGALFAFAGHRANQQVMLLESGHLASAVITAVGKVKFMRSGDTFTELKYRYEPSPGQAFEGKSGLLEADRLTEWKIGDRGNIKFDDASPARSVWMGK
jgi:hypothetical protein